MVLPAPEGASLGTTRRDSGTTRHDATRTIRTQQAKALPLTAANGEVADRHFHGLVVLGREDLAKVPHDNIVSVRTTRVHTLTLGSHVLVLVLHASVHVVRPGGPGWRFRGKHMLQQQHHSEPQRDAGTKERKLLA